MKEEKKAAKKKAAKKVTKKLESILDLNSNNIWDLDEFAIAEAWERERRGRLQYQRVKASQYHQTCFRGGTL